MIVKGLLIAHCIIVHTLARIQARVHHRLPLHTQPARGAEELDDSLDGLSRVFGHFLAKSLEVVLVIEVVMAFVTALLIIIV